MSTQPQCPHAQFAIKDLEDVEPYNEFAAMRQESGLRFDESMGAWIAQSYENCKFVFRNDKVKFLHPDSAPDAEYKTLQKNRRHPKTLDGDEHTRVHQWLVQRFSPRQTSQLRDNVIRHVINDVIDRFVERGSADLAFDFADNIPIAVIAAVLDLPWEDAAWVGKVKASLDQIGQFYNKRMAGDEDLSRRTGQAFEDMRQLLDPTIEARRDGTGEDIVSQLWRDGPNLLPDWTAEDVYINLLGVFIGGYDTTTMGISNACKLLLDDSSLRDDVVDAVVADDDAKLKRFVEESLRVLPPVQYRARVVKEDTEIAGQMLKAGEIVVPLIASANRDEEHYVAPDKVDLDRKQTQDHMTFAIGPRMCVGAGLARIEIFEAIRTLLCRLPDIRYAEGQDPATYHGLVMRRYYPLNAVFTPAEKIAAQ